MSTATVQASRSWIAVLLRVPKVNIACRSRISPRIIVPVTPRMEKYINSKGRQIIGWDEILQGGLAPNAKVMSWLGEEGGIKAAQQHH